MIDALAGGRGIKIGSEEERGFESDYVEEPRGMQGDVVSRGSRRLISDRRSIRCARMRAAGINVNI